MVKFSEKGFLKKNRKSKKVFCLVCYSLNMVISGLMANTIAATRNQIQLVLMTKSASPCHRLISMNANDRVVNLIRLISYGLKLKFIFYLLLLRLLCDLDYIKLWLLVLGEIVDAPTGVLRAF